MLSIGLQRFLKAKNLNYGQVMSLFLQHMKVTKFTPKDHRKVNIFVDNYWVQFATFVDKGLKDGTLKGNRVKLNTYYDEQAERDRVCRLEVEALTEEEALLWRIIKKYDDSMRLSRCNSFFTKLGFTFPPNDEHAVSRVAKLRPKLQMMINSGHFEELKAFLVIKP